MNKKDLSERDICTKYITPAVKQAGWDEMLQIREEVGFTKGRIIVRGKLVTRGKAKRADYVLYYKPNIPIAIIEAKDNNCSVGDGIQQALDYAVTLNIPFVFSSNGTASFFTIEPARVLRKRPASLLMLFRLPANSGRSTAHGKDCRRPKRNSSSRTTSTTEAEKSRATTSARQSMPPSKPSQRGVIAYSS
jgi:type I site-specific restriction endonuclease